MIDAGMDDMDREARRKILNELDEARNLSNYQSYSNSVKRFGGFSSDRSRYAVNKRAVEESQQVRREPRSRRVDAEEE